MRTELDRIAEIDFARKEGEARGVAKEKASIAKAMLAKNFDEDVVMEVTGLSKEELEKLA